MRRPHPLLPAALVLLLPAPFLPSQGSTGCGAALILEWGTDQPGGIQWECSGNGPLQYPEGRLRCTGRKGTWCTLLMRAKVENSEPERQQELQDFLNEHPWLAPLAPWPITNLVPWATEPTVVVQDTALTLLTLLLGIAVFPELQVIDEDAVKSFYQPILETDPPTAALTSSRVWNANPPVWSAYPPGGPNPVPNFMIPFWMGMLVDLTDMELFGAENIGKVAILLQAPPGTTDLFFQGDGYARALSLGLYVDIQAIALRSPSPNLVVTSDETTTDGLRDLFLPPENPLLPVVNVSPPLTIQVIASAPLGGGTGPFPPGVTPCATITPANHGHLRNIIAPMYFTFQRAGGGTVSAAIVPVPGLVHPLRFSFTLPCLVASGPVTATNPAGTSVVGTYNLPPGPGN